MPSWASATMIVVLGLTGCSSQKQAKPAGSSLPLVADGSAALPGATDAADAPHAPSVAESPDATLTTYRDPIAGVSFRYPAVWRPPVGKTLPQPAFNRIAGAPRITQQFTPGGTDYAPTVLLGLSFSYAVKDRSDETSCAALPLQVLGGAAAAKQASYGGVPYAEAVATDAAACIRVQTAVDSTLRSSQCLVFERDFVTSCPDVKKKSTPRPLSADEMNGLQRRLDSVMQSVRIAEK